MYRHPVLMLWPRLPDRGNILQTEAQYAIGRCPNKFNTLVDSHGIFLLSIRSRAGFQGERIQAEPLQLHTFPSNGLHSGYSSLPTSSKRPSCAQCVFLYPCPSLVFSPCSASFPPVRLHSDVFRNVELRCMFWVSGFFPHYIKCYSISKMFGP